MTRRTVGSFLALILILAACGGGQAMPAGQAEVRPIDDVLASDIVVTPDSSGASATLTVTTSIPLACAVIYGVDDDFGSIATDADMDGGAHTQHAPVLTGLEPDTEYVYVLQGSDAAGNLYRSEVVSFVTPPAAASERPGENIAPSGTVVDVSSEFSDAFVATNAIDGDPVTEWSSSGDGNDAWITIELTSPAEVVGFAVRSRSMADGSSIIETYQVTVDGDTTLGPFAAGVGAFAIADAEVTGLHFRFDAVDTTGGNTGIAEIEIYVAR